MKGLGVGDPGDKPQRDNRVVPPHDRVGGRREIRRHADGRKDRREKVADDRGLLEGLRAAALAEDPGRLEQEAPQTQREQRPDEQVVLVAGVFVPEPLFADHVPPVDRDPDADDKEQPHQVHHERVRSEEGPSVEGLAGQRPVDIHIDRQDRRRDQQREKPPDNKGVHHAAQEIAVDLLLVRGDHPAGGPDPLAEIVEPGGRIRPAPRVPANPVVDAVEEHDDREHREKSKDHLLDRADLPERLAGDLGAHRFAPSAISVPKAGRPAEHPYPRIVGAYERR